ncbi:unnamed protein product [Notodromas monacha]|uniref:Phosphofurin acidic cluster sorting protein 1/2 N-terminal C2 domain-containing protein n=1 Tax=Notodromas monacha TaxID=399045 RepID=A0A7R9BEY5_9CRUS|nr:unnamed protein product [Notodromas monacha]CAG0912966.1 unnamed protein product [Notodromas monacha]
MTKMAEKGGRPTFSYGSKPVPMKLFATWEVDKTQPYCIPRLCMMRLSRLVLMKTLGNDVSSVLIAVKMQSSKRILRSNEIALHANGLLDTELDLSFSLQYPHFLKRDGNKLQVMLQRRKRYKNRTILGYKTLAIGSINMSQVLQKPVDLELELVLGEGAAAKLESHPINASSGPNPSCGQVCARISVVSLSSQPVNQDSSGHSTRRKHVGVFSDPAGSAGERDGEFSDDDDDFSSNEEGSDSEPMAEESHGAVATRPVIGRKVSRGSKASLTHTSARQRNLKQKFVALLKRFKVSEDFQSVFTSPGVDENLPREMDPEEIEDWIDELEDLGAVSSESGNEEDEEDTLSISSTPKPSLRPFFSSRSLHESMSPPGGAASREQMANDGSKKGDLDPHPNLTGTDTEHSDPQPPTPGAPALLGSSSSPPKGSSGDEMREKKEPGKGSSGFSDILYGAKTLFPKEWGSSGPGCPSFLFRRCFLFLFREPPVP